MATGLPPSFYIPDQENKGKTKSSEPSELAIISGIGSPSPLLTRDTNTLRQRRRPEGSAMAKTPPMSRPPRASLSMSMGTNASNITPVAAASVSYEGKIIPAALNPNTSHPTGSWVLVYGFSTKKQYDEVLAFFKGLNTVLDHKCAQNGESNWVAIQYENPLGVEVAMCHSHYQTQDGYFCGVRRLEDSNSFFLQQQQRQKTMVQRNMKHTGELLVGGSMAPDAKMSTTGAGALANGNAPELSSGFEDQDIFLNNGEKDAKQRRKTVCEDIMAWIYGW